ncbi:MAG TPA: tRNA pseudouridine(38-40) synthase TruA [Clostridiales bacterium]|jgi:tRNA pseudouridine38-40 synthase|nr:tRNA pseudouridine(38-40) synthase TruA [Clostridiales bacterium]
MRNIALLLSYDGTNYHGWQTQENAVTVQETIEHALSLATGEKITLYGCGRTDAGVHAKNYVASFRTSCTIPAHRIPAASRRFLPPDITIWEGMEVPADFHARFSCVKKEYVYSFYSGTAPDPFLRRYAAYTPYPIRLDEMQKAAAHYTGTHDFAAFCASGSIVKSTVRNVFSSKVEQNGPLTQFFVSADGFLYNMVRIMAGTLLYVSLGKLEAEDIPAVLAGKRRMDAGITAPPQGLCMNRVWYHEAEFTQRV